MSSHWTTADIPDQTGRRAIITGGNSGIGYPVALELARHGATVVIACRDLAKGEAAAARIRNAIPQASIEVSELNLADLADVQAFADRELARDTPLDLLINNAGVYAPPKRLQTKDSFELQFGTNVLGHFALTAHLLPALQRAAASSPTAPRVVFIASIAHKHARIRFTDLQYHGNYSPTKSYGQSKLADLMLSSELDRRLRAGGETTSRILSVAAHPGVANTNLFQAGAYSHAETAMRRWAGHAIGLLLNSDVEGALPTLYAATAPGAKSGGYYGPQGFAEMRGGDVGPARIAHQARDTEAAAKLWEICEDLTHTHLP
jgi:NAD(P)-dependent dehydrogenase (short-subunit alcohol dehydrogenase family)